MPSLIELVERINGGDALQPQELACYQESPNSAERFLAHHAGATLQLRACHTHLYEALKAIEFSDRKVLEQYIGLCGFLGRDDMKTSPMVQFGRSAIERGESALGLEAIAQAVAGDITRRAGWASDRANGEHIASAYAAAAAEIGWAPASSGWSNTQKRIAYIVSSLGDEEPARAAAAFARTVNQKQFRMGIYSTEAFARRDRQEFAAEVPVVAGSLKRGAATIARIKESKSSSWITPTTAPAGGDLATAAAALADQLVNDQTDVLIIDADPSDAIAALICHWNVARVKLWIARRVPLYSSSLNAVAYIEPARCAADADWWQQQGVPATNLVEGMDLEAPVSEAPRRSAYGIPDSAVILTTAADDVNRTITPPMVDMIADVLKKHPQAVYLLVGGGETTAIRRRFESAGVGKRVGYAGKRRDLPGFLKMTDVYVSEFPAASSTGILQAMTMSLPVIAMTTGNEDNPGLAAELVGPEATVAEGEIAGFAERLNRLIRDPSQRQTHGRQMRRRVEQLYAFDQTARALECLCERQLAPAPASDNTTLEDSSTPAPARTPQAVRKAA